MKQLQFALLQLKFVSDEVGTKLTTAILLNKPYHFQLILLNFELIFDFSRFEYALTLTVDQYD